MWVVVRFVLMQSFLLYNFYNFYDAYLKIRLKVCFEKCAKNKVDKQKETKRVWFSSNFKNNQILN